jgi:regulatory protein
MNTDPHYLAQDILSRRDHSQWELQEKLKKKGVSYPEIQETIVWLKAKKYLNDATFARNYIERTIRTHTVGKRYLAYKLKAKRVPSDIINTVLKEIVSEEIETELMKKAAQAWKKSHPKFAGDSMRLGRFLLSRGFSSYLVQKQAQLTEIE